MTTDERGPGDRPALSRCTTLDAADFAARHWGREPLFTRGDLLGQDFSDLFSLDAVDELVAERALRTPFARMAKEGDVLSASRFTASGGFGAEVGDQLDADRVLAEFATGSTLVLQGLHRTWQPIADFSRRLAAELGHPCQVNAYVTPASSRGFDPHYDVHDVFVLQIAGEKHWRIHEPVHPDPLRDQPWGDRREAVAARARDEPVIDAVFRPGDALYLPRGWLQDAARLDSAGVPETSRVPTNKSALALSLLEAVLEDGVPATALAAGPGWGESEDLVQGAVERNLRWLPAVPDEWAAALESGRQRLLDELGLGHFEGRSWRGFHHHACLVVLAHAFLESRAHG